MTKEEKKRLFFKKNDAIVKRKLTELLKRKPGKEDYNHILVIVKKNRSVIIKYKGDEI